MEKYFHNKLYLLNVILYNIKLIEMEVNLVKIWKKVSLSARKDINLISNALTNYIYKEGPITDIYNKYNVDMKDRELLDLNTSRRIAGLIVLYTIKDTKRINDILNKYNYLLNINTVDDIYPEVEGYVEKK